MMTWLEVLKVSNSHVWPRVGHDLVPTLTLSSPSVHDQYFVPSPELELWQNVGLFARPPVSGTSNVMSQNVGGSEREAEIIMFFWKIRSRHHVLVCDLSCFISKTFKQTWIMQTRVRPDSAPSKHNFYDEFLNFSKFPPDQFTENDFITTHIFRRNYLQENCFMSKRISALGFYILQTWI